MEDITIRKYYLDSYNIEIKDSNQVLFIETQKKTGTNIFLVPELLYLTGMSEDMRNNEGLKKELILKTQLKPDRHN